MTKTPSRVRRTKQRMLISEYLDDHFAEIEARSGEDRGQVTHEKNEIEKIMPGKTESARRTWLWRIRYCKADLPEESLVRLLRKLNRSKPDLCRDLESRPLAMELGSGKSNIDARQTDKWNGVLVVRPTRKILGQRIVSYQVVIPPGKRSGDEWHAHREVAKGEQIPYGDELLILNAGRAKVEVGDESFNLEKPGDAVIFKSHVKHSAYCPATEPHTRVPDHEADQVNTAPTVLTVVRFPYEEPPE